VRSRLLIVAGVCAGLALPASAAAHTGIASRSPGSGKTVAKSSLTYVKVSFEGRVSDATLVVRRGGTKVSRGDGSLANRNRQVRARLTSKRSGRHTATVRWLSSDGHVLSKSWSFRLR
jgi:methionine-rich copper-binding protein CopC